MRMSPGERLIALVLLLGVAGLGYFVYQSPQIRELFGTSRPPARVSAQPSASVPPAPAAVTERKRPPVAAEKKASLRPVSPPKAAPAAPAAPAARAPNQVPNQQVARILLQILAARGLASGISLSVSDDQIEVVGATGSEESRQVILEVIEKGRENRKIVADQLNLRIP